MAAALLGVGGFACSNPGPANPGPETPGAKVHPQGERTLACNGFDLRIPALDESMTLAWASFQVAQQNQEVLAPLESEARRSLFDACVLPAIVGAE